MNPGEAVFRTIVVPTDFSAQSECAWRLACRLAHATGASLVLAHVLVEAPLFSEGPFGAERVRDVYAAAQAWAEGRLAEWVDAARAEGLEVRSSLRVGTAHRELLALVATEGADLVVVGTHGRGGLDRALLGSVADRLVRLAPCPVLAVRETAGD